MITKKNRTKAIYRPLLLVFIFAFGFMIIKGFLEQPKIAENQEQIAKLQEQIEYEKKKLEEVDELKGQVDSDEYIEKIAREKLGLIKQDEIVFIDIAGK